MPKSNKGSPEKSRKIYPALNFGEVKRRSLSIKKVSSKPVGGVYMDYAASAVPNPSSIHSLGVEARAGLENARKEVAENLSARPSEIFFTSGGTEGNNLAIQGLILHFHGEASGKRGGFRLPHVVTTNIEHPSVLETLKMLKRRGMAEVSVVGVDSSGIVDPKKLRKEIKDSTVLVSVMYANNEIGTIEPISEIARVIRHYKKTAKRENIFFHTDAVQALQYLDMNVLRLGVDMLTLSGSKLPGAGRVGILYKKKGVPLENLMAGGDQEAGLRPGTENLAEILKFSQAFKKAQHKRRKESDRTRTLRNYLLAKLEDSDILRDAGMTVNGSMEARLPNNLNITFPKIPSDLLVIELSARGIMASSKSACKSSESEGSYVIHALQSASAESSGAKPDFDPEIGGLRFSFGVDTSKKDIDYLVNSLVQILQKLDQWYN